MPDAALTQKDSTTFECSLGDTGISAHNIIGGSDPSKFIPNLNSSRWSDEAWINLNCPVVVSAGDILERTSRGHWKHGSADRIEWTHSDIRFSYFPLGENVLETCVEFAVQPSSNDIVFDIEQSGGFLWGLQDKLTSEEIIEGVDRPENVVGSYVVYFHKGNNQYRTGKFLHAYCWEVIDRSGRRERCIVEVVKVGGIAVQFVIHLPGQFMQNAIYPVVAMGMGDTFGYTSVGGSNTSLTEANGSNNAADLHTASSGDSIDEFHFYTWSPGSLGTFEIAAYDAGAGPTINGASRVAAAEAGTSNTPNSAGAWEDITGLSQGLVAGNIHFIAVAETSNDSKYYYDTPGGTYSTRDQTTTTSLADPWNEDATGTRRLSLWANVAAGGATVGKLVGGGLVNAGLVNRGLVN